MRTAARPWRPAAAPRLAPGGAELYPEASATAAGIGRAPSRLPAKAWASRTRPISAPRVSCRRSSSAPTISPISSSSCGALYNSGGNVVNEAMPTGDVRATTTARALQRLRDRRFRRVPQRRVRGEPAALAFVREVGFCSTFYRFPEGVACLWEAVTGRANPRWPRHSHHDAGIGLTWSLKDVLPTTKRVYYGKLLKGRPLLVALDVFPMFYALVRGRQRARDYRVEYEAGRLSHTARRIMDAMVEEHPQYTRELRANVFMLEPGKTRGFER